MAAKINMAKTGQTIITWVVGIAAFLGARQAVIAVRSANRDPIERAMMKAINARDLMPELEQRTANLSTDEAFDLGMQLSMRGIGRLPDSSLRVRAELLLQMTETVSLDVCARWSLGTLLQNETVDLIRTLDRASLARWADMSAHAMEIEMDERTRPFQPSEEDIEIAFADVDEHDGSS